MSVRGRLRALVVVPGVYALIGAWFVAFSIMARQYLPPTRGVLAGVLVLLTAVVAARRLWHAAGDAPRWLLIAGMSLFVGIMAFPVFDMVNATSDPEPPSWFERYGFLTGLSLLLFMAVAAPVFAWYSLKHDPTKPAG